MSQTAEQLVVDVDGFIERTEGRIERLRFHERHGRDTEGAQRILDRAQLQRKRLLLYRSTLLSAPALQACISPDVSHARRLALT
jgi:hypothetical protein